MKKPRFNLKNGILALSFFGLMTPHLAFSATNITCTGNSDEDYSIKIEVDIMQMKPPKSRYRVFEKNDEIKLGYFTKREVYSNGLNTFAFVFRDHRDIPGGEPGDSVVVSTSEFSAPTRGSFSAKGDIDILKDDGTYWSDFWSDCTIVITH